MNSISSASSLILKSTQPLIVNKSKINGFSNTNNNDNNKFLYRNYSNHLKDSREQLYRTLKVKPGCRFEDIRESYVKLCFELHPDTNSNSNNNNNSNNNSNNNNRVKMYKLSSIEKREKLVKVINSYKELKKLNEKGLLLSENYIPSNSKFSNFKHYTVYPGGPYYDEMNPIYTNSIPVYGSNQLILAWILAAISVISVLQYYRFEYSHRSLVEERNRRFEEAEETYRRVRELANSMTSRERIKKFIEDYFDN